MEEDWLPPSQVRYQAALHPVSDAGREPGKVIIGSKDPTYRFLVLAALFLGAGDRFLAGDGAASANSA